MLLDAVQQRVSQLYKHRAKIEEALKYTSGTFLFEDVCHHCLFGHYHLFENDDSFLIGYVIDYPRQRAFHVFLAGGKLETLVPLYDEVKRTAKGLGCTIGTFTGRRGWKPLMEERGWKEVNTSFVVSLTSEDGVQESFPFDLNAVPLSSNTPH